MNSKRLLAERKTGSRRTISQVTLNAADNDNDDDDDDDDDDGDARCVVKIMMKTITTMMMMMTKADTKAEHRMK